MPLLPGMTREKPVLCEWHEVKHSPEGQMLRRLHPTISDRGLALIDAIPIYTLLDALGEQHQLLSFGPGMREAMDAAALYVVELETEVARLRAHEED